MAKFITYCITFISGCVFLGLELVASRVLAPFFGNSIYVWGALISVFLLALSVGYFLGGRLADHRPSFLVLGGVIALSSFFILLIPYIDKSASLAILSLKMDFRTGLLLACCALFLIPSILMGMVSPYVIKLTATELGNIGAAAGNIYAISTMGSICGALAVSFYLVPAIGSQAILLLCGGALLLTTALCGLAHRVTRR